MARVELGGLLLALGLAGCVSLAERPPLEPLPERAVAAGPPERPPAVLEAPGGLGITALTSTSAGGLRLVRVPHPRAATVTLVLGFPALADARRQGWLSVARQLVREELVQAVPWGADAFLLDFGSAWSLEVVTVPEKAEESVAALAKSVREIDAALEGFARRRLRYLQNLVANRKSYVSLARNLARIGRYGATHPWAQGPATRVNELAAIEADDLREAWPRLFDLSRAALVAVGPADHLPAPAALRAPFGDISRVATSDEVEEVEVPALREEEGHRFHAMWFHEEQVRMEAMYLGPAPTHPDFPAFTLLEKLIGGGFRSGANRSLRHDLGATYGVGSQLLLRREASELHWGGWVDPKEGFTLFEVHRDRVKALLEEGIDAAELEQARIALVGERARRLEDPENVAEDLARCAVVGIPATRERCLSPPVSDDPSEIERVAQRYIDPKRVEWSMVGNPTYVATRMEFEGIIYRYKLETPD